MRHRWLLMNSVRPFFEGEGAGGGGTGGTGGTGGEWKAPDGLPAEFAGKDPAETVGKLFTGYQQLNTRFEGLRTDLAKRPAAPGKPEEYTFNPSDKVKPFFPDAANNKFLGHAKTVFHKHGIPDQAFGGIIGDMYEGLLEAGVLTSPFDPKSEVTSFAKAFGLDVAGATTALTEADTFAKGLLGQLKDIPADLKEGVEATMASLTDTAAGNALLRALSARLADSGIRVPSDSTGNPNGPLGDDDLNKLTADPRIDPRNRNHADVNRRFDETLRKRYDEGMAERGRRQTSRK